MALLSLLGTYEYCWFILSFSYNSCHQLYFCWENILLVCPIFVFVFPGNHALILYSTCLSFLPVNRRYIISDTLNSISVSFISGIQLSLKFHSLMCWWYLSPFKLLLNFGRLSFLVFQVGAAFLHLLLTFWQNKIILLGPVFP